MSLRRSVPKKEISSIGRASRPAHDPKYSMHYCISRRSGMSVPGHFFNPPEDCVARIVDYGGERWVDAGTCLSCPERKRGCEAKMCDHKKTWDELKEEVERPRPRRRS